MNSIPNVEALLKAPVGNPDVVGLLERVLADAREGKVAAIAMVFSGGPGSMNAVAAGGCQAELFMGCSAIQQSILQNVGRHAPKVLRPM